MKKEIMKLKMKGTLDPFITMALTTNIILLTTVGVLAIYAYITYPEIQWTEKSINNLDKISAILGCDLKYKIDYNRNDVVILNIDSFEMCVKLRYDEILQKIKGISAKCDSIVDKYGLKESKDKFLYEDCQAIKNQIQLIEKSKNKTLEEIQTLKNRSNREIITVVFDTYFPHDETYDPLLDILTVLHTNLSFHLLGKAASLSSMERLAYKNLLQKYNFEDGTLTSILNSRTSKLYTIIFGTQDVDRAREACYPLEVQKYSTEIWSKMLKLDDLFKELYGESLPKYKYGPENLKEFWDKAIEVSEQPIKINPKKFCYKESENVEICEIRGSTILFKVLESMDKELDIYSDSIKGLFAVEENAENCDLYLSKIQSNVYKSCKLLNETEKIFYCKVPAQIIWSALEIKKPINDSFLNRSNALG